MIAILAPLMGEKRVMGVMGSKLHGGSAALWLGAWRASIWSSTWPKAPGGAARGSQGKKHLAALPYAEVGAALEAIPACTASEAKPGRASRVVVASRDGHAGTCQERVQSSRLVLPGPPSAPVVRCTRRHWRTS